MEHSQVGMHADRADRIGHAKGQDQGRCLVLHGG
jgi:hypothetical protein